MEGRIVLHELASARGHRALRGWLGGVGWCLATLLNCLRLICKLVQSTACRKSRVWVGISCCLICKNRKNDLRVGVVQLDKTLTDFGRVGSGLYHVHIGFFLWK